MVESILRVHSYHNRVEIMLACVFSWWNDIGPAQTRTALMLTCVRHVLPHVDHCQTRMNLIRSRVYSCWLMLTWVGTHVMIKTHLHLSPLFSKVEGQPAISLLSQESIIIPVSFAKLCRTTFLQKIFRWLIKSINKGNWNYCSVYVL